MIMSNPGSVPSPCRRNSQRCAQRAYTAGRPRMRRAVIDAIFLHGPLPDDSISIRPRALRRRFRERTNGPLSCRSVASSAREILPDAARRGSALAGTERPVSAQEYLPHPLPLLPVLHRCRPGTPALRPLHGGHTVHRQKLRQSRRHLFHPYFQSEVAPKQCCPPPAEQPFPGAFPAADFFRILDLREDWAPETARRCTTSIPRMSSGPK